MIGLLRYLRFRLIFETLLVESGNPYDQDDEQGIDLCRLSSQYASEAIDLFEATSDREQNYARATYSVLKRNYVKIGYDVIYPIVHKSMPWWHRVYRYTKKLVSR